MKSTMGKKILLAEVRKRAKLLEQKNKALEQQRIELEKTNEEISVKINDLHKELEDKQNLIPELDKAIALHEKVILNKIQKWNDNLQEKNSLAIVQFDDGSFDLVNTKDLRYSKSNLKKNYDIIDIIKLSDIASTEIMTWVNEKSIPKDIIKKLSKDYTPLPKNLYVDQRQGKAWSQMHFRGIEPEKYKAVKEGKMELWQALIGQSVHIDLRIDYGLEKLVQYVMTENDVQSMFNTLTGAKRETANGIMNVQHSKIVSKPSGEPPEGPDKFYKAEEPQQASINEAGAKLAQSLDLDGSYWIDPGGIGATVNTYSYMMLIWEGKVITGTERHDLHELFMYKENSNKELFNGKFTVKCLDDGTTKRWEIWKSISDPRPLDPIMHSDIGYHWLIPEEKVEGIGREYYRNVSKELYAKKYV